VSLSTSDTRPSRALDRLGFFSGPVAFAPGVSSGGRVASPCSFAPLSDSRQALRSLRSFRWGVVHRLFRGMGPPRRDP